MTSSAAESRLKAVAIPPEHGAWGFLLEPLLLGLLVAPSAAGALLALGVVGGFLARHPLKIALIDWQRRKRYARTRLAERVALIFGGVGALGVALAVILAGPAILLPFLLAIPLGALVFASYARNRGRELLPELAGATALALSAISIALAAEAPRSTALALWIVLTARSVPSILFVRARLRLDRDRPHNAAVPIAAHLLGVAVVGALVLAGTAPILALVALIILLARAVHGLSPQRPRVRVQTIGFLELGYGLLTVLLTAIGYAL